jgi:hypothetical protein
VIEVLFVVGGKVATVHLKSSEAELEEKRDSKEDCRAEALAG